MRSNWNRSRATAIAATLLLHLVLAVLLLSLKQGTPPATAEIAEIEWIPPREPLPRVGTAVTTPEGETILWVSDYCYISLSSTSLTMNAIHEKNPPAGQAPGQQ